MLRLRNRLVREVGEAGEAATGEAETAGDPGPGDVGTGPGVWVNIDREVIFFTPSPLKKNVTKLVIGGTKADVRWGVDRGGGCLGASGG
jgi:hypothetical protein